MATGNPEQRELESRLRIYPNPIGDDSRIHIEAGKGPGTRVRIYNIQGQLVYQGDMEGGRGTLSPDVLPCPGLYIIQAENGGRIASAKINKL